MKTLTKGLAAALPLLLASAVAQGQSADGPGHITLKVEAPETGEQFGCRLPVTISHAGDLKLQQLNVVAKAYHGNIELASTGIETDGRTLIRDRDQQRVEYQPTPVQFELVEEDCEKITGLGIVLARCTFAEGAPKNCLDRLRVQPDKVGRVALFIGEMQPPER